MYVSMTVRLTSRSSTDVHEGQSLYLILLYFLLIRKIIVSRLENPNRKSCAEDVRQFVFSVDTM